MCLKTHGTLSAADTRTSRSYDKMSVMDTDFADIYIKGDALVVCCVCTDILIVNNANIGYIMCMSHAPDSDTCALVYTTCGGCVLKRGLSPEPDEDNTSVLHDGILNIAMSLGYDSVMMAIPDYLEVSLVMLIVSPESKVTCAVVDIQDDEMVFAKPLSYVTGSFLMT